MSISELIARDLNHIWHPCTQMKDFLQCPPLIVEQAKGSILYTNRGEIIDAISSWWCKSLGHGHPTILAALEKQLYRFEHVITAHTSYDLLSELGEKLAEISNKQHVFFASDGACAVEIAMKLALQSQQLKGAFHRNEFIALKNAYHGETLGALSVSDLGLYKKPYTGYGVSCHFIQSIPYIAEPDNLSSESTYWEKTYIELEKIKTNACALIVEPLVQGAAGMRCYHPDFLKKLSLWAKENDIYFIADEIMTGLARTGRWFALDHAETTADLICLSKGLTSGTVPLSCVLVDHEIYSLFYNDYETGKAFLHSHTYSGNALAVSAALATLHVMEKENMNQHAEDLGLFMRQQFEYVAQATKKIKSIRHCGAIVAGDLINPGIQRLGFKLYQEALKRGALLRPIGDTLYWLPPLNTNKNTIEKLTAITIDTIEAIYR